MRTMATRTSKAARILRSPAWIFVASLAIACEADPDSLSHEDAATARDAAEEALDSGITGDRDGGPGHVSNDDAAHSSDASASDARADSASDAALTSHGEGGTQLPAARGLSAGCGQATPNADSSSAWTKHDLMVSGVASRFLSGGAKYGKQNSYDFTHRNFFLRLPVAYDAKKPYALVISGPGCGATDGISGNGGGSNPLSDRQDVAVQVGLSYVYPMGAGACFADETSDTPDLPYFDAVLAEVDKAYCFDRSKVFVSGFSSGAWETYMLACARGGIIRGIGTQAGGLRKERPPCSNVPVAAFLTAGVNDDNPIQNVDATGFDTGSQAARDVILKTNGCVGTATTPYLTTEAPADWHCVSYTGCPMAFPVVWCAITADGGRHGAGSNKAFWPFWSALPAP
jgi:polyhydroxybutyrate depolymerase